MARECRHTIAILLLIVPLAAAACGDPATAPTPAPTGTPALELRIAAVPTAPDRLERWCSLFQEEYPGVALAVLPASAAEAQEALAQGRVDLAYLDQPPDPFYRGVLTATRVASEPIALLAHPDNPLVDLSLVAAVELLSGRAENWSGVGGEDSPVQVYLRPDSAGEVRALAEAWTGRQPDPQAIVRASAASLRAALAQDRGGLGVLPAGDAPGDLRVLRVDGFLPAEPGYPWHLPLFLVYGPGSPDQARRFVRRVELDYAGNE